jgi:hypothetical protein
MTAIYPYGLEVRYPDSHDHYAAWFSSEVAREVIADHYRASGATVTYQHRGVKS